MEVEHCIRGDGEEIRNFLHRIKGTVDKGWPDRLNSIEAAHHAAERVAQARQRRQRYIDYSLKGLRPRYLQRKAQAYLMENPNATLNDFSTRIIQRDVSFQVSSNFLNDEEQTNDQMATLGQEMKNLGSVQQEHRVNAVEKKYRTVDPNQKGRQNATRFCNYCPTNGHTPNWYRKKIRDEELKRIGNERTAEKKVTFSQDYNKKRGPDDGSGQWTRGHDFQRKIQNYNNDGPTRIFPTTCRNFSPRPNFVYENNLSNNRISCDRRPNQSSKRGNGNRSRTEFFNNSNGNWRNNGNFSLSPSAQRRDFSQNISYRQPRGNQPNNSAFRRPDNRPKTSFTPYEQKFPQDKNQTSSNVVRITTTDDTINELWDLCPINSNTDKSRNSRLSPNIFYFATGDAQKDSGLEIKFMLDTGASCSIITYRNFWEICQLEHSITIQKSIKVTRTYSRKTDPMLGYATITLSYDLDGQLIFPLTVWITEMRTQNLFGMDFCQKQVSGVRFDLPEIEIKNPPKSICFSSFHQNKSHPHLLQMLTIRTTYTMCIDANSARCWKYSPTDSHIHFPPCSIFQPNRICVATGLSLINTLCTRFERNFPILMEKTRIIR